MHRLLCLVAALPLAACFGDEEPPPAPPPIPATVAVPASVAPAAEAEPSGRAPVLTRLDEAELAELWDPFQPRKDDDPIVDADAERKRAKERLARVPFAETAVSSLRVRGTLSAGPDGRAIVVDERGETRVVAVGMRIGREVKDRAGAISEWKIDAIREGEVVLVRNDSLSAAPETLVLKRA